jgi:hypothetical protein
MNQEIKAKWVEALRSEKYEQTNGILRSENGFCCLGVLCDVLDPSKWGQPMEHHRLEKIFCYENWDETLPKKLREDIGISIQDQDHLMYLNDTGHNFKEIANHIEQKL